MNKKGSTTHFKLFSILNFFKKHIKKRNSQQGKAANTGSQKVSNDTLLVRGCKNSLVLLQEYPHSGRGAQKAARRIFEANTFKNLYLVSRFYGSTDHLELVRRRTGGFCETTKFIVSEDTLGQAH